MFTDNIIFIIPARKGSRGLPGKNMVNLMGKPLIQYTIECAMELTSLQNICISTNDEQVIDLARKKGLSIPFKRPESLARDDSSQYDVIKHALQYYSGTGRIFDTVVFLQPTSPLRKPEHIREALSLFTPDTDMVVSVKKASANPYFVLFEENQAGLLTKVKSGNFIRRQDCPEVWEINGAGYVINCESLNRYNSFGEFTRLRKHVMEERVSVDIDDQDDLDYAEFIMNKYKI